MENTMGKLVCEVTVKGVDLLKVVTTAPGANVGQLVKTVPGIGKPYWYWPTIPAGAPIACDFTGAPIVESDIANNNTNIAAITALPEDVLTFP